MPRVIGGIFFHQALTPAFEESLRNPSTAHPSPPSFIRRDLIAVANPASNLTPLQIVGLLVPIIAGLVILLFGVNNIPDLWKKAQILFRGRKLNDTKTVNTTRYVDTLPRVADLVNRTTEVESIKTAIDSNESIISIAGPTGVGKSAIAVSGVALYRDDTSETKRIHRNTLWIDVHDSCPTLKDLARVLSLCFSQPGLSAAPSHDKELVIRRFLADNPTVLVIDNLTPAKNEDQQALMDLLESLPAGSCAVLSWGESVVARGHLIRVEDLSLEHAGDLLVREAKRQCVLLCKASDTTKTVTEIYDRLGGNPQGLKWLVLEIKNSARSVGEALDRLVSRDSRIYAELFGNIWDILDQKHKTVMIGVADARMPTSREYLSAATGLTAHDLHESVDALLKMGILERAADRPNPHVRLPNITRSYVIFNADQGEIGANRRRLIEYYIQRLESDWEDAAGVEDDIENIIQVFLNARQDGDCISVLKLFVLILDILFTLGLFDDRITLGHAAVDCARRVNDPTKEALAWSVISSTHTLRAEYRQADQALVEGRLAAENSASVQAIAYQARCRAYNLYREGRIAEAKEELAGSLEQADSVGDVHGAIDIVALECSFALYEHRITEAKTAIDDFNNRIQAAGWRRAEAYPYQEYAELALWQRNFTEARDWAEKAQQIASQYRDRRQLIRIELTLGRIALYQGDLDGAETTLAKAASEAAVYGLTNELTEIRAHLDETRRKPRWLWARWYARRKVPNRLSTLPIGGD